MSEIKAIENFFLRKVKEKNSHFQRPHSFLTAIAIPKMAENFK